MNLPFLKKHLALNLQPVSMCCETTKIFLLLSCISKAKNENLFQF